MSFEPMKFLPDQLTAAPPPEKWDNWVELDAKAWPKRVQREMRLVPTICFNCESACGLLAYVDKKDGSIRRFEGNPVHPGSRGRVCAKGPATLNQIEDPDRILFPLKRAGERGSGKWERISWEEALNAIGGRIGRCGGGAGRIFRGRGGGARILGQGSCRPAGWPEYEGCHQA